MSLVNRKILVIVEGARKELKLINRLKELFLPQEITITSYGTSLYQLYDKLEEYCEFNFEDLFVQLPVKFLSHLLNGIVCLLIVPVLKRVLPKDKFSVATEEGKK